MGGWVQLPSIPYGAIMPRKPRKGHTMPKAAKNIEVRVMLMDRWTKGHFSRDEVCLYPEGAVAKVDDKHIQKHDFGVLSVSRADLPEYALNALEAGRYQPFTKKAKAYDALKAKYATVQAPAKKAKKNAPSIEDIMAEAEKENAKRDASNATPTKARDYSKLTKADLIRRLEALEA